MKKSRMKKIWNIIANVLVYLFLAICIFTVIVTMLSKRSADGTAEIFGYQMRVVTSNSMEKCDDFDPSPYKIKDIPLKSMVFVKVMPDDPKEAEEWYRNIEVGDVLTFRYVYTKQVTITHRVSAPVVENKDGGFTIQLSGDNRNSETGQLDQVIDTSIPNNMNYVIGEVVGQSYLLGVVMTFLMSPAGIIGVIIVPCFIIIMIEIFKIAKLFSEDKKKKVKAETEKKDNELEELRRKLAELEMARAAVNVAPETPAADEQKTEENTAPANEEPVAEEATKEPTPETEQNTEIVNEPQAENEPEAEAEENNETVEETQEIEETYNNNEEKKEDETE